MFNRIELICRQEKQKRFYPFREPAAAGVELHLDSSEKLSLGFKAIARLDCREPADLLDFRWELSPGLDDQCRMMVNGFQSWSWSGEMASSKRLAPLAIFARPRLASRGDYRLQRYSWRRGRFHSWTFTCFKLPGGTSLLLGSLDETTGYTIFQYDFHRDRLLIRKDCRGASVSGSHPLLSLYIGFGEPEAVMDEYCGILKLPRRPPPRATGWSGCHIDGSVVSGEIVRQNLNSLTGHRLPLDYIQVDDGWQSEPGDWLESSDRFPGGMKALAGEIHAAGFRAGLWLAPFICSRESRLFQENPQWLLRNDRNKPVRAGYNPGWNGWFYALDFYAPGFREYLGRVFETALAKWDYDLLKLDFLYAAALLPRDGKTRGGIMTEVMDFIHKHTSTGKVLAGGVPLGPAMGRVDYCRTAGDTGPAWDTYLKKFNYRERVSAKNSLESTIGRRLLDRRGFRSDPGVFMLGDTLPGRVANRLNAHQRHTQFFLKNLLGGMVFLSDDSGGYSDEQLQLLRRAFPNLDTEIHRLENSSGLYCFEFSANRKNYTAFANLAGAGRSVTLEDGPYFHPELFVLGNGACVDLEPYQTICFHRVEHRDDRPYLLGCTGHIYPGAQVEKLIVRARSVTLQLHDHASPETRVFLAVPRGVINLSVNKVNYPVTLKNRIHFVTVPFDGRA